MSEFLESLLDRKELIKWKFEKKQQFIRILNEVKHKLGVKDIEIRYSWSAENNSILFLSLLKLIGEYIYIYIHIYTYTQTDINEYLKVA